MLPNLKAPVHYTLLMWIDIAYRNARKGCMDDFTPENERAPEWRLKRADAAG